jgi:hypothetical protein
MPYVTKYQKHLTDHLGIALLRNDLSIINETIINLKRGGQCARKNSIFRNAQDYRLFTFGDRIMLSSGTYIAPIQLLVDNDEDHYHCPYAYIGENEVVTTNMHTNYGFTIWIREYDSCIKISNDKNLLYFTELTSSNNNNNEQLLVDWYPSGNPHAIFYINMTQSCNEQTQQYQQPVNEEYLQKNEQPPPFPPPKQGFHTIEELIYPSLFSHELIWTEDRGSACCGKFI